MGSIAPEDLLGAIARRSAAARRAGALRPIETGSHEIEEAGIRFRVRAASNLARKDAARRGARSRPDPAPNPFLPPEPELLVGEISDTHRGVLNKFNVIDAHLLVVTRAFEHQESLLTAADFDALARCLSDMDGLGFYNGGEVAGASQPHKHLQLVPLPLGQVGAGTPLDAVLPETGHRVGVFPFVHAFDRCPVDPARDVADAAAWWREWYVRALAETGVGSVEGRGERRQGAPYNLLVTRRWILLVPRSREHFEGVSVNGLGYAGSLFVRAESDVARIRAVGPIRVLTEVSRRSATAPDETSE